MYCINCGNKISENDNFCFKCGAQTKKENINLIKQDDAETTSNLNKESSNNNPANKKSYNQNQTIDLKVFSDKCVSCSTSIDEKSFKVLNNKPYCIKCFNRYSYQSTSSNNEFITSDLDNDINQISDEKIESDGCGFKLLFIIGFLSVVIIGGYLFIDWTHSNKFIPQPSKAKNISNYPNGVSSACFCMDALSGGSKYGASYEQKVKCRTMFKCWDNAQADCLLKTSRVWYECIN